MPLTLPEFIARWQASTLSERSAAQSHFIDLCDVLGERRPADADPTGTSYTFEKHVSKARGGKGYADVWKLGCFAWEYKGKHKNLEAAYQQLLDYTADLENPPLLVVCDFDRFEVHTSFTNTRNKVYSFNLAELASPSATPGSTLPPLEVLRAVFRDPDKLRPERVAERVTEQAAADFAAIAASLRARGKDPEVAARFLMRLLFCLFAEDIRLLPPGLFTKLVENTRTRPEEFNRRLRVLFGAMATGGSFGVEDIEHFNGGLFDDDSALDLTSDDLAVLARTGKLDWTSVEPAVFGTLFERSLDPSKRSQLGAHYTSKEDILLIVEPVLMALLRCKWAALQEQARALIDKRDQEQAEIARRQAAVGGRRTESSTQGELSKLLIDFAEEIASVRVLDPACGSGNFLYVALKLLLDLEKEVHRFATSNGVPMPFQRVDPSQLYGIEVNPYAYELASVVVWIGYIQWLYENGYGIPTKPILKPLHNVLHMDAILAYDENGKPVEPEWPEADVIVGNPPFLGGSKLRRELGDDYTTALWKLYEGRVPAAADLVCYWFERARTQIAEKTADRAGLIATQAIRAAANQAVLARIKQSGDIFLAWSDKPWVLDGASVRVSIVGFDAGTYPDRTLNGALVNTINADLTGSLDTTQARLLAENTGIAFMGAMPAGPFDIDHQLALSFLAMPLNTNGRSNSDVVRPFVNAQDLVQRDKGKWAIDFATMPLEVAACYEGPFEYIRKHVYSVRQENRRASYAEKWWQFAEARPGMRRALSGKSRYLATPRVSKHRIFVWLAVEVLPTNKICVFARDDDYFFGVLHSHAHEVWSLATSSRHGVGNDPVYNNTACFETFPFPWPPGNEPQGDPGVEAIAQAARKLVEIRDRWLNPEGASEAELKKRTLTNLYNERPTWLQLAHEKLDRAVLDAYGWPHDLSDEQILERLLALNLERAR